MSITKYQLADASFDLEALVRHAMITAIWDARRQEMLDEDRRLLIGNGSVVPLGIIHATNEGRFFKRNS